MFHSANTTLRRSLVGVIILLIVIAAGVGGWLNARNTDATIREQLQNRAETVAYLLNKSDVSKLTGNESDEQTGYYQHLKETLAHLKTANSDVRGMYITVRRDDKLYFYVDSEQPDSQYYSAPGEYYPDATPLFKSLFLSNHAAVEGPSKDDYGTWVSGLAPIDDSNGNVLAVLGIDIDATYYYEAIAAAAAIPALLGLLVLGVVLTYERIRRRDQHELQFQSELVSIASHELRSPLSGIRWATELLMSQVKDEAHRSAELIHTSTLNLQAGVEDILQLTKLNNRKHAKLELADVDMTTLVKQICDTQRLVAEKENVALVMSNAWLAGVVIRCDADKMKRALHNLVSNAIKYSRPNTSVTITYSKSGKHHQISVADQGIGIPVSEQSKVFSGFYRASNAKESGVEGTGMGLMLTQNVIKQHKGKLELKSEQNVGTTITFWLPIK